MGHLTYTQLQDAVPNPGETIHWEDLCCLIPALRLLDETPQDEIYHAEGDVGIHTRMVCTELVNTVAYENAPEHYRFVLFYAALLHDIAKPSCTRTEETGRISSAGHSRRGAIDTRILLWEAGVPFLQREWICNIITKHQIPFFILGNENTPTHVVEKKIIELSLTTNIELLSVVAEADMRGRHTIYKKACLQDIELFKLYAQELDCFHYQYNFHSNQAKMRYLWSDGSVRPEHLNFYQDQQPYVIMLSGLPASGKDTWCRNFKYPVVSFDDARDELGIKHGSKDMGKAAQLVKKRAKEHLRNYETFIWNATNLSQSMRRKTLKLLFDYDADVNICYLETSFENTFKRNSERNTTLSNEYALQMGSTASNRSPNGKLSHG